MNFKLTLFALLGLAACAPAPEATHDTAAPAAVTSSASSYQTVDIAALKTAHEGGAYMLDVRTPAEYAEGHIDGAVLVPLQELPNRLSEVPKDQDVYVICRSGNRSAQASQILADAGYSRIINVSGGITDWQAAGYPVVR